MSKATEEELLQEILKIHIHYNPSTGIFKRKLKTKERVIPLDSYGELNRIMFGRKHSLTGAKAAFLYVTGKLPTSRVFKLDGNKGNFKWSNLSLNKSVDAPRVTRKTNNRTVHAEVSAKSPYALRWYNKFNNWTVIRLVGKSISKHERFTEYQDAFDNARAKNEQLYRTVEGFSSELIEPKIV